MDTIIEKLTGVFVSVIFVAMIATTSSNIILNTQKIIGVATRQDKSLMNVKDVDQKVAMFNKFDYLFIGMANNKTPYYYILSDDRDTQYKVLRNTVPPQEIFEAVVATRQFKTNVNYTEGLSYNFVKFRHDTTTTNQDISEGVSFN